MQPIIDLISPVAKVLIDLGYDWSGNPGDTRYLSILPFSPTTNWLQVGVDLVRAVGEGIENVFGGGSTMIAPADTDDVSPFNARIAATTTVNEDEDKNAVDGQHVDVVDERRRPIRSTARRPRRRRRRRTKRQSNLRMPPRLSVRPRRLSDRPRVRPKKAEREAAREAAKAEREAAHEAAKAERRSRRRAGYGERRDGTGDGCTRVGQRHRRRLRSGRGLTATRRLQRRVSGT